MCTDVSSTEMSVQIFSQTNLPDINKFLAPKECLPYIVLKYVNEIPLLNIETVTKQTNKTLSLNKTTSADVDQLIYHMTGQIEALSIDLK